jgi:protein gp37
MGETSAISWCDSTSNPEMGCQGCELWRPKTGIRICYAGTATEKMLSNGRRKGWPPSFDQPTLFPGRIEEACRWKDLTGTRRPLKPWLSGRPRVIFLNDMGDTFTAGLPVDWLAPYLPMMGRAPHLWLILTKHPARAVEFSRLHALPPNVWLGTSCTGQQDSRVRQLQRARAALLFVSYEPMLRGADPKPWLEGPAGINWVIVGGASGDHGMVPEVRDYRRVVERCHELGRPVFVKQDAATRPERQGRIPDELFVREFPR